MCKTLRRCFVRGFGGILFHQGAGDFACPLSFPSEFSTLTAHTMDDHHPVVHSRRAAAIRVEA
ncbi:MAG: hypothetical protein SGI73_08055 [Chloroflexota bacterium]|nr:hypothetical protein [Chloroflexota bacterium]